MLRRGISMLLRSEIAVKCRNAGNAMFKKHLLFTNVTLSMGLSGLGDVLQQNYNIAQGDDKKWNCRRTFNMTISGLTVGVLCHFWYIYLDQWLPGRSFKIVTKKVIVDQLLCSPICISSVFLTVGFLDGDKLKTILEEIVQKGWRLYVADCIIWPPAQAINFYVLPTRFRVLYDNTISLGFDVYTTYVKHEIPLDK